jgi:pyruvate kinase
MSQRKIICTIGPVTAAPEKLRELNEAGMDVARLNGSHADMEWHANIIAVIKEVLPDTPILLDIPGRKIRTTALKVEPTFSDGDTIILTTDTSHDGSKKVPVNYGNLHRDLSAGHIILADDGTLRFTVIAIDGQDIVCRADVDGQLKSRKGINVPHVSLGTQVMTERDHSMIEFAKTHGVDYIGISFVESADHVSAVRDAIAGSSPRIVSKVENRGGLANVAAIAEVSDALMIDRGDLSVETNLEDVTLNQKRIIDVARQSGKPVIVATELLHTMIENRFPTKAEVSDITNAVLDGCAATMLSGETAIGKHHIDVVRLMRQVSDTASSYRQEQMSTERSGQDVPQAIEDAIALICRQLPVDKIIAVTKSGFAAEKIAVREPRQPILAVSNERETARAMNLLQGTEGVYVDIPFSRTSTDHLMACLELLWREERIVDDEMILVTAVGYPRSGNRMNLIQTHVVGDIVQTLGWKR